MGLGTFFYIEPMTARSRRRLSMFQGHFDLHSSPPQPPYVVYEGCEWLLEMIPVVVHHKTIFFIIQPC